MSTGQPTDTPAAQPEELDGDALAQVQGGAASSSTALKADEGSPAAAEGTRKTHAGDLLLGLRDGSVRQP